MGGWGDREKREMCVRAACVCEERGAKGRRRGGGGPGVGRTKAA